MPKMTLQISSKLDDALADLARETGTSKEDLIRRGLAVMLAFRDQKALGRKHIGFSKDPKKLDVEITNVL